MTQEEKLEEAKRLYETANTDQKYVLERLFPELKESEDGTRKEIIKFVKSRLAGFPECDKFIAWLKKQGEQNHDDKVKPKFHEGEWITNGDYTWKIVEVEPLDYILQSQDGNIVDDTISHVDEQFHSFTIKDAKDGDVLVMQKTNVTYESIFIFFKIENNRIIQYLHYFTTDAGEEVCEARSIDGFLGFVGTNVHQATKEQRNLLFQKMREAGYEWDAEKKELKKIEQNPAWSEENETMITDLSVIVHTYFSEISGIPFKYDLSEDKIRTWLNSLKDKAQPKQEWSEEDEKQARQIERIVHNEGYTQKLQEQIADWLKSLKDRIQPIQEWSEEDENRFRNLIYLVEHSDEGKATKEGFVKFINRFKSLRPQNNITDEELAQAKKDAYNDALDKIEYHSGKPTFDDGWSAAIWYLKKRNAQPQNTWKPSEEQIIALRWVLNNVPYNKHKEEISGLLDQIKKL